jgi:hypothetical protein
MSISFGAHLGGRVLLVLEIVPPRLWLEGILEDLILKHKVLVVLHGVGSTGARAMRSDALCRSVHAFSKFERGRTKDTSKLVMVYRLEYIDCVTRSRLRGGSRAMNARALAALCLSLAWIRCDERPGGRSEKQIKATPKVNGSGFCRQSYGAVNKKYCRSARFRSRSRTDFRGPETTTTNQTTLTASRKYNGSSSAHEKPGCTWSGHLQNVNFYFFIGAANRGKTRAFSDMARPPPFPSLFVSLTSCRHPPPPPPRAYHAPGLCRSSCHSAPGPCARSAPRRPDQVDRRRNSAREQQHSPERGVCRGIWSLTVPAFVKRLI